MPSATVVAELLTIPSESTTMSFVALWLPRVTASVRAVQLAIGISRVSLFCASGTIETVPVLL